MYEILAKHSSYVCLKVLLSGYSIFWSAVNLEGNGRCFEFLYTQTHIQERKKQLLLAFFIISVFATLDQTWIPCASFVNYCKKKKFFFFWRGGHFWKRGKFDERCHRFITSTNMTNFVIPPLTSAISVPPWNHQKTIGFSYDLRGNRNSLIRLIEV